MRQTASQPARLDLSGMRTLRTASETFALLKGALGQSQHVLIDCDGTTELDLSLIQLLLSARASALASGGKVSLASAPEGKLLETLTRAGMTPTAAIEGSSDFWFQGDSA